MLAEEQNLPAPDPLTETVPGRVGLLRMASNEQARSGDFLLQMARVEVPPEGTHYDAWLIGDTSGENEQNASDTARLFLGELDVLQGHVYLTGSHAENLLESYSRLIVSLEDTPANLLPSEQVVFAGDLTTSITPEVFALLSGEDEDSKGALFGAEEQTRTAIDHKGFAQESLAAGNLDEAKMHLEHVINILDGEDGQHFGDLNLDGQTQNPGDGVGVRGYLLNLISEMETLQETADLTGDQQFHAERISTTATNRLDTIEAAIEQARRGIASDTIAEAQPVITESERLLTELLTGSDLDNNGVIDPLLAEGGITQAQALTLMLNDVHIFPLEIEQTTS
jgi:hypothetical protein